MRLAAALLLLAVAAPASAALNADAMKQLGGTYMAECGDNASVKVTVFENDVVFLNGSKRIAGTNAEPSYSFFGNSPPEGFLAAVTSDTPQGQLLALVYEDDKGPYIKLDGDAAVVAQIGKAALAATYRVCGAAAAKKAAPAEPAPKPKPATGASMDNPKFRQAYFKALGLRAKTAWLAKLDGPAPETEDVEVASMTYSVLASCKAHDCHDYNLVVLYSPAKKVAYGKIYEAGRTTWIGSPPAVVANEIDRQWKAAFRSDE